jgi:hypothetical protein
MAVSKQGNDEGAPGIYDHIPHGIGQTGGVAEHLFLHVHAEKDVHTVVRIFCP